MKRLITLVLVLGVCCLGISINMLRVDPHHALQVYTAAFGTAVGAALGALLLIMISHSARARWFVLFRRPAEAIAGTLPLFAVLFLPIAVGVHLLYPWAEPFVTSDAHLRATLAHQRAWLHPSFFVARAYGYFLVWIAIEEFLRRASKRFDRDADPTAQRHQRIISAVGIPVLILTVSFAGFDWFMSLDAGFRSDMFGLYIATGAGAGGISALVIAAALTSKPDSPINADHTHALGRLLLVSVCLWGYIAVCQLILIWIANLPDEVTFLADRQIGPWFTITRVLVVIHFILPFVLLLSRPLKRLLNRLAWVAGLVLFAHALDLYWVVVGADHGVPQWTDFAPFIVILAVSVVIGAARYRAAKPVPSYDPDLASALAYESP